MKVAIGLWCGEGSKLLADLHGTPLLRVTYRRVCFGHDVRFLIPWNPDLDHMEDEIKSWRPLGPHMRCSPKSMTAMRDLVAALGADIGLLIQGGCAVIDRSEINAAVKSIGYRQSSYTSPRILGFEARALMADVHPSDWPEDMDIEKLRQFYTPRTLEAEARMLAWRKGVTNSAEPES